MAGDWLKIEVSLPDKPEVWQIAGALGIEPDTVVGKLLKVWRWFDAHTESGNARSVSLALVDSVASVSGFGEAMVAAGWLAQGDGFIALPNFDRHNGKTAKNRALTAKRVAKTNGKTNACSVSNLTLDQLPREELEKIQKELSLLLGGGDKKQSATEAGRACLLMRQAGCLRVNSQHPDLLAALSEGVTPEQLAEFVKTAIDAGKGEPFAYAIAAARGAAKQAKNGGSNAARPHGRKLSPAEQVAANIAARTGAYIDGECERVD